MPYYITSFIGFVVVILFVFAPGFASFIIWKALENYKRWSLLFISCAYALLVYTSWQYFVVAQTGQLTSVFAIFGGTITAALAIVAGLSLLRANTKHRYLIASSISIVFPALLAASIAYGLATAWTYGFEPEGERIIHALETYKGKHGTYPDGLADLIPSFLNTAPMTDACGEWSYQVLATNYQLQCRGYMDQASYKFAYCEYQATQPEWICVSAYPSETQTQLAE